MALAAAGAGTALLAPRGWANGRLSPGAAAMWRAVALAVLDDLAPPAGPAREQALGAWIARLEATIAALPPHAQAELGQLCTLLASSAGRIALFGLGDDWERTDNTAVQARLQALRISRLSIRQQLYHALRDLTNAAWFADPGQWARIGYPGPREI